MEQLLSPINPVIEYASLHNHSVGLANAASKRGVKHDGVFSISSRQATEGPASACVWCGKSLDCGGSPNSSTNGSVTSSSKVLLI